MQRLLLATGLPSVNKLLAHSRLSGSLKIVDVAEEREEVISTLQRYRGEIDAVLISDALPGREFMMGLLPAIRMQLPDIRVIYLT